MTAPPAIPTRVESYDSIPSRLRPLYDGTPTDGYQLSPAGRILQHRRTKLAADPGREPTAPRVTLDRPTWARLVAVAEPGPEREWLMRAAAQRRIRVEG